jgi:hypothetical protein
MRQEEHKARTRLDAHDVSDDFTDNARGSLPVVDDVENWRGDYISLLCSPHNTFDVFIGLERRR